MINMNKKSHLEMYKEMHAKEVERISYVTSRVQWSISIWIVLFGGLLYAYNSFDTVKGYESFYYISISIATICSLISIIIIFIGLYNTKIQNLPRPTNLKNYYKKLEEYYENLDIDKYDFHEDSLEEAFEKGLEKIYVDSADNILIKNDKRIAYSHWANIFMMIFGIFLLITFALMIPNTLNW
ncbi:hypothetical protein [Alkalicoccus halolimnae]|uniref:SMODS and SLOG-associating 2TM effector domain-containing protein n=1 Tax=Alkalicoccus halolimnae TaxID=1667239 RepID=A0A5C7FFX5_9BACI|nr:hypothetical protein [Alkalicoccus halolimnae]TXF83339.1 hypothetical protein FTX54_13250 [Alkalicoccus halolimnae]